LVPDKVPDKVPDQVLDQVPDSSLDTAPVSLPRPDDPKAMLPPAMHRPKITIGQINIIIKTEENQPLKRPGRPMQTRHNPGTSGSVYQGGL